MMHMGRKHIRWQDLLVIPLFMLAATGIGDLFDAIGFPETNIVLVYVAAVLLVARFTHGLYYGLAASVIATFAFNYFFTDPRFTFAVSDTSYLITFAIMMFTSLITSALTARVKKSAREATERAQETQALYELTNRLSDAQSLEDIGAVALAEAPPRFHARLSCREKTYVYRIWNSEEPNVFERNFLYTVTGRLDMDAMQQAAERLLGRQDFSGFCGMKMKKSAVRELREVKLERLGGELRIRLTGDGFLYNMVRIIVGTLIEVGRGERKPEDMESILNAKNRAAAGFTAPAKGLTLWEVRY